MVKKEENQKKKQEGITLIALVITIITLLILAGVTISALTGNNRNNYKCTKGKDIHRTLCLCWGIRIV